MAMHNPTHDLAMRVAGEEFLRHENYIPDQISKVVRNISTFYRIELGDQREVEWSLGEQILCPIATPNTTLFLSSSR